MNLFDPKMIVSVAIGVALSTYVTRLFTSVA